MNNLYNNDITSLEYTGVWFLKVTLGLAVWFILSRQLYKKFQIEPEARSKAKNDED